MGTRSVVAEPQGDAWRGRYVHWDGYPSGVGHAVLDIVRQHGVDTATRVLVTDHYGWSSVNGQDKQELGLGYTDGRFQAVPGYGIAYTTEQGQSSPDDYITPDGDDWGTEWAYVIGPRGLTILVRGYGADAPAWRHVAYVAYAEPPSDEDWARYDSGEPTLSARLS